MRLLVKNFGPVREADINTKPLTVFIGPNGAGKSYVLYLIWALYSIEPDFDKLRKVLEKNFNLENLPYLAKEFMLEILEDPSPIYANLSDHLKRTFRIENPVKLIREGSEKSKFEICSEYGKIGFELGAEGLNWRTYGLAEMAQDKLRFGTEKIYKKAFLKMFWGEEEIYEETLEDGFKGAVAACIPSLFMHLFEGYFPYYAPFFAIDGRGGLMRERETFIHEMLTTWRPPVSMSAPASSFIRDEESLNPEHRNEHLAQFAEFAEEKLGFKIELRREPPRYVIKIGKLDVPIFRAPSGYRELAPILYELRYSEDPFPIFAIEEPEAHLHPDAQSITVRMLAGVAAKSKAQVFMTTHELRILDEISNLLRLNKLNEEEKRRAGYERWEGISPDDVCLYFFRRDGIVEPVEVFEDGLGEHGLERIYIEMANTHALVERIFREKQG